MRSLAEPDGPLLAVRVPPEGQPAVRRFLEGAGVAVPATDGSRVVEGFALVALAADDRWLAAALVARPPDAPPLLVGPGVTPGRRGRGHGTRLLDAVADALRARGETALRARPDPGASAWMERRGFTVGDGDLLLLL